ncbi:MAG: rhodanese-like domain-containing protein [Pseudomonadota bacterium]
MFVEFLELNLWWFVAFMLLLNLLLFSFIQGKVKGASHVSVLEMPALQRNGKSVIYDVNSPEQFSKAHIAGALNLSMQDISGDNKKLVKNKDNTVIVVCQSGGESVKAAKGLVALGFNKVHMLKGGLISWQKENLPLVSS